MRYTSEADRMYDEELHVQYGHEGMSWMRVSWKHSDGVGTYSYSL
jgi:hypothetical protein